MIVPVTSPQNTDLTNWVAQCDACGQRSPIDQSSDWLFTDDHLDFHLDPHCERRIGTRLIQRAAGPTLPRFIQLVWPRRPQTGH
jgi:hypothetical protein